MSSLIPRPTREPVNRRLPVAHASTVDIPADIALAADAESEGVAPTDAARSGSQPATIAMMSTAAAAFLYAIVLTSQGSPHTRGRAPDGCLSEPEGMNLPRSMTKWRLVGAAPPMWSRAAAAGIAGLAPPCRPACKFRICRCSLWCRSSCRRPSSAAVCRGRTREEPTDRSRHEGAHAPRALEAGGGGPHHRGSRGGQAAPANHPQLWPPAGTLTSHVRPVMTARLLTCVTLG